MKYFLISFVVILSLLTACSKDPGDTADAVIKKAELTNFEENLVEVMNNNSFIYDVTINNEAIKNLHATVDYYENGVFVHSVVDSTSGLSGEKQNVTVRVAFLRQAPVQGEEEWIEAVFTGNGYTSSEAVNDAIEGREELNSTARGGISSETSLDIGEKKVIATIVHSNKNGVSIYNDIETEEELQQATDYEQVYIISIELSN